MNLLQTHCVIESIHTVADRPIMKGEEELKQFWSMVDVQGLQEIFEKFLLLIFVTLKSALITNFYFFVEYLKNFKKNK